MTWLIRSFAILAASVATACAAHAATTIQRINLSTTFGYVETHYPGPFARFSVPGMSLSFELSDGRTLFPGAGLNPFTNGRATQEWTESDGTIRYEFGVIDNYYLGQGVLLYHRSMLWDQTNAASLWSQGQLTPIGNVVLTAHIGSAVGTISGLALATYSDSVTGWAVPPPVGSFVPYAVPTGSVVPYSATYTLLNGATWQPGIFNTTFQYNITGEVSVVPENPSYSLLLLGLTLIATRARKNMRIRS
jgi:hypothetical protein